MTGPVQRGLIFRLAYSDLIHDWPLSICLVLALAAVIAPLLLIFGLKFGTIETLRLRLTHDPANREIRPLTTVSRDSAWFLRMAERPDVEFLIPLTRQIAANVFIKSLTSSARIDVDLIPTGERDPLLLENHVSIPKSGEIVLSATAASALSVQVGDHVSITVTRARGEASEHENAEMRVVGTLPMRASGLKVIYTPLRFLEAVEEYRDGLAVSELGWKGSLPIASPEYDGAVLVLPEKLLEDRKLRLVINTGFTKVDEISRDDLNELAGWTLSPPRALYLLKAEPNTVREDSLSVVRDQLRGLNAEVIPWIAPIDATIGSTEEDQKPIQLQGLSLNQERARQLGITPIPPWGQLKDAPQILLPGQTQTGLMLLKTETAVTRLTLPLQASVGLTPVASRGLIPSSLAGTLRLSRTRRIKLDPESHQLLLEGRGYAGFRMYARTIDDVGELQRTLIDEGVIVRTEAQRIAQVTDLDHNLTQIFLLISSASILGGVAALIASLYASIQRKRREIGVLRLIGLFGHSLMRFPIYQSILIATLSYLLAIAFFNCVRLVINHLFGSQLVQGESFCHLPIHYQAWGMAGSLTLAALAASFAAFRTARTSPAEVLRDR